MIRKVVIFGLLIGFSFSLLGQKTKDSTKTKFPIKPVEIGLLAMSQVGFSVFWYTDFGRFTFRDDLHQWRGMDKLGHVMSAYQVARSNRVLCDLAGMEDRKAKNWSAISTTIFYTGIEVLDGFSNDYGFSWSDFAANAAGIGLASLPLKYQERFSLKFSYSKTKYPEFRPEILGEGKVERVFKDYNGQTYWLSFWQPKGQHWYDFIGLSVGYGANGMYGGSFNPDTNAVGVRLPSEFRARQLYLTLDFNLEGLAPNHPKWQKWLRLLDFIKVPLPGLVWEEQKGIRFLPIAF